MAHGEPAGVKGRLLAVNSFELFSVEPEPVDGGAFHGYEVIGSVNIEDSDARRTIVAELFRNFEPPPEGATGIGAAYCFEPRLAIRATDAKGTVDLLICYACGRMRSCSPEPRESYILQGHGQQEMRAVLREHGIRIAPDREVPEQVRSRVRIGEPSVDGDLDPDALRGIVRQHVNELRYCYDREVFMGPKPVARPTVRFSVVPAGRVSKVRDPSVSGLEDGSPLAECIQKAVGRWRFPRSSSEAPTGIELTFEFSRL